eukprot:GFUD01013825.1.p1 GENE.GFUD01013825.1~~GFUD01013825.1.p1  ORF type:complete len:401 (+),score=135.32 GFUD01013825.1:113-1315(+)
MSTLSQKLFLYQIVNKADRASRLFRQPAVILQNSSGGGKGSVVFNRPRFFNCIDDTVINPLACFLSKCCRNDQLNLLLIGSVNTSKKNATFSTGADLIKGWRIIDQKLRKDSITTEDRLYLINFYRTQHMLHHLTRKLNTVALLDGITMGSAVLFGLNAKFSVATERTVWAVPEVTIGSLPDVGTLFHLKQLPGNLGKMLALTGMKVRGGQLVRLGLATHFCKNEFITQLSKELEESSEENIEQVLNKYQVMSEYEDEKEDIKIGKLKSACQVNFQPENILEIIDKLRTESSTTQLDQLHWASPLSLKATSRLYKEISGTDYDQALLHSYKVAGNLYFCPEMKRGIEAALLSGGKKKPDWKMKTLADVPEDLVEFCFENAFQEGILTLEQLTDRNTENPY